MGNAVRRSLVAVAMLGLGAPPIARANEVPAAAEAPLPADLILTGGKIVTNAPDKPIVEAVAVRGGSIVAAGSAAEIARLAGPETQRIDLKGRTMLPGFYDNHIHLGGQGEDPRKQDWKHVKSKAELLTALKARAAAVPKGEWIYGELTNENMPQERLPTRWEIDAAVPEHPVVLERGHITIGSSLTMKLSGVTDATPVPPGGGIDRDAQGRAIGWFREGAGKRMITKAMPPAPPIPDDVAEAGLRKQLAALLPLGITSINVAGMRPETLRWIQQTYAKWGTELPRSTVQLRLFPGYDAYDNADEGATASIKELEALSFVTGFGNDRLRLGAVKMSIDGGFSAAAFYTLEPYPHRDEYYGVHRIPKAALYRVVKRASELGWQLGIHAIGDGAVKEVVDVYAQVLEEAPREDHRFFVHHLSVLPPEETLAKMEKYRILTASQPNFTYSLGPYNAAPALSPERLATNNPQMSLIRHNIRVSYGSDGMPTDPRVGIYAAVTRKGIDGKVYGPGEKVPLADAIRRYTWEPAYMNFVEKERGSIEAGKVGDFVVLGQDILTVDPEKIMEIPIDMTIVAGKPLYMRPGQ